MPGNRQVTMRHGIAAPASDTQPAVANEKYSDSDVLPPAMQIKLGIISGGTTAAKHETHHAP